MAGIGGIWTQSLVNTYGRISSGQSIPSASDNPSGLAVEAQLTAQANGFGQGASNATEAEGAANVASGALGSVATILQQLNTLGVEGSSDLLDASDRQDLQVETNQLVQQLDSIGQSTNYNGVPLLQNQGLTVQTGATQGATSTLQAGEVSAASLGISALDLSSTAGAQAAQSSVQTASTSLSTQQAELGAQTVALGFNQQNARNAQNNLTAASSAIGGANIAQASSALGQEQTLGAVQLDVLHNSNSTSSQIAGLLFEGSG